MGYWNVCVAAHVTHLEFDKEDKKFAVAFNDGTVNLGCPDGSMFETVKCHQVSYRKIFNTPCFVIYLYRCDRGEKFK